MDPQPSTSRSIAPRYFPYESHGITVKYPESPYHSQKQMTDTLLDALSNGENCLLESPTGTGKTFAILCTLLAHREHEIAKGHTPRPIYYACPTIPQLSQVKNQLSTTPYNNIRAAITAGRRHLCINEDARSSVSLDDACQAMRDNCRKPCSAMFPERSGKYPRCKYFENIDCTGGRDRYVQQFQQSLRGAQQWGIEDINKFGKDHTVCPYYLARAMADQADLILCPYNYLLHPFQRKAVGYEIKDSIIVFDEAHHVESKCMEIGSAKITHDRLQNLVLPALDGALARPDVPERKRQPLNNLAAAFRRLDDWLRTIYGTGDDRVHKINNPAEVFRTIGWGPDKVAELYKDSLKVDDQFFGWGYDAVASSFKIPRKAMGAIHSITWVLKVLFHGLSEDTMEDNRESYSVDAVTDGNTLELRVTCLNPAVVFKSMKDAHTVILTSATLAPLEPYSTELGIPFSHKLITSHVVHPNNVFAGVISKLQVNRGGGTIQLNFSSKTLRTYSDEFEIQAKAAAEVLQQIFRVCPGGMIVYFSSKSCMRRFMEFWERRGLLSQIAGPNDVFFECDWEDQEYERMIKRFCERAEKGPNGAILFAVFGGRASEGVDFRDDQLRAVVLMGIPYPPVAELKVVRKKEYHDRLNRANSELMNGWAWYERMAFRCMNQALGRCIRHVGDWGAIIFLDERMEWKREHLPQWVKDSWKGAGSVETMIDELKRFLDDKQENKRTDLYSHQPMLSSPQNRPQPHNIEDQTAQQNEDTDQGKRCGFQTNSTPKYKERVTARQTQMLQSLPESHGVKRRQGYAPVGTTVKKQLALPPSHLFPACKPLRHATTHFLRVLGSSNALTSTSFERPRNFEEHMYGASENIQEQLRRSIGTEDAATATEVHDATQSHHTVVSSNEDNAGIIEEGCLNEDSTNLASQDTSYREGDQYGVNSAVFMEESETGRNSMRHVNSSIRTVGGSYANQIQRIGKETVGLSGNNATGSGSQEEEDKESPTQCISNDDGIMTSSDDEYAGRHDMLED